MDPGDEKYIKILRDSRVYTPLPKRDKEGRTIILGNYGKCMSLGVPVQEILDLHFDP